VQILGIREDPYAFFLDMFKLALGTTHYCSCLHLFEHDRVQILLDMFKLALGLQLVAG
jgi:hypothetical protein